MVGSGVSSLPCSSARRSLNTLRSLPASFFRTACHSSCSEVRWASSSRALFLVFMLRPSRSAGVEVFQFGGLKSALNDSDLLLSLTRVVLGLLGPVASQLDG